MLHRIQLLIATLLVTIFASLMSGVLTGARAADAGPIRLRVVQYNVYYGKGTDEVYSPSRQVDLMLGMGPDVISLNEVLPGEAANYKTLLDNRTGFTWHSYHIPAQADGTGNQILSKYPIRSASSYFMRTNGEYNRGVAQATLDVNGTLVNFFSTHLDHNNAAVRAAQVGELKGFLAGFAEPRLLAGDFNARPDAPEMLRLTADYADCWDQARSANTAAAYPDNPVDWDTITQKVRKDYVFYSQGAAGLVTEGSAIPDQRDLSNHNVLKREGTSNDFGVRPSDHNLVFVTLLLGPPPDTTRLPAAPGSLTATAISNKRFDLQWADNSDNEDGFAIEESADGVTFTLLAQVNQGETAYSNKGLKFKKNYFYRVCAFNAWGRSAPSNVVNARRPN